MLPRSPSPNEPNNGCGCSLMHRDIVEQFPGDICGESLGMSPSTTHPLRPTHFSSSSTEPGHCCRQGPPTGDKKRGCCCLHAGEMDACFPLPFFLFASLVSHSQKGKWGEGGQKKHNVEERKKAILRAVAFHHTTDNHPTSPSSNTSPTAPQVERERVSEERGERRGGPGPCDTESMRAQLHPQAEWTGACCVSPAWLIWLRGRRTATALPALTPYSPGPHEHTQTHTPAVDLWSDTGWYTQHMVLCVCITSTNNR